MDCSFTLGSCFLSISLLFSLDLFIILLFLHINRCYVCDLTICTAREYKWIHCNSTDLYFPGYFLLPQVGSYYYFKVSFSFSGVPYAAEILKFLRYHVAQWSGIPTAKVICQSQICFGWSENVPHSYCVAVS